MTANDDGFTLVEMLITLAIVGVVFALFSAMIGLGRDVLGRSEDDIARLDELTLSKRLLTESLTQAVLAGREPFSGTRNGFAMVAYGPQPLGHDLPLRTWFEPHSDGGGLQVGWTETGKDPVRRSLSSELRFDFSYFQPRFGWIARWDVPEALPELVRVEVHRGSDFAAEFVIAVGQLAPPVCIASPAGRCAAVP